MIADFMSPDPKGRQRYRLAVDRVIAAILLGTLTFDANRLVIRPCAS